MFLTLSKFSNYDKFTGRSIKVVIAVVCSAFGTSSKRTFLTLGKTHSSVQLIFPHQDDESQRKRPRLLAGGMPAFRYKVPSFCRQPDNLTAINLSSFKAKRASCHRRSWEKWTCSDCKACFLHHDSQMNVSQFGPLRKGCQSELAFASQACTLVEQTEASISITY